MRGKGKQRKAIESRMRNRTTQKKMPKNSQSSEARKSKGSIFPFLPLLALFPPPSHLKRLARLAALAPLDALEEEEHATPYRNTSPNNTTTPAQQHHQAPQDLPKRGQNRRKLYEKAMENKTCFSETFLLLCLDF